MKARLYFLLLVFVMILSSVSHVSYAGGDGWGSISRSSAVKITEAKSNFFTIFFSISGLQPSYPPGADITLTSTQKLTKDCTGDAKAVVEFYNSDSQLQSTYIDGNEKFIGSNLKTGTQYTFTTTYTHPNAVVRNIFNYNVDASKEGAYSISAYILCSSISGNANLYSTVNEYPFLIEKTATTTVIGPTTTGTSTTQSTTTTVEGTVIPGKLELISSSILKSQLKIGEGQTVMAQFKALQEGDYILESFWQSTNEQFSILPTNILVNECDQLAGINENPQFRNKKVHFNKDETRDVNFVFPPITFAGNFIAWVDAVEACRSSTFLIQNTRVSGFKVTPDEPLNPNICTKSNGALCTPPNEELLSLTDGSGPSIECKSGWCQDIRPGSGRCAKAGAAIEGRRITGSPDPQCVALGTVKQGFDLSFLTQDLGPLPVYVWLIIGFVVLFFISAISRKS